MEEVVEKVMDVDVEVKVAGIDKGVVVVVEVAGAGVDCGGQ